jgi:hypothetical protein
LIAQVGPGALDYAAGLDSWLAARKEKQRQGTYQRKGRSLGMALHLAKEVHREAPVHCAACAVITFLLVAAAVAYAVLGVPA